MAINLPYNKNDFKSGPRRHMRLRVSLSANGTLALPAYHRVSRVYLDNTTSNAVTGGIRIGTAAAGTQLITAAAVGADATVDAGVPNAGLYSAAAQTLYIEAVTAWNGAKVDVIVDADFVSAADENV